MTDPVPSDIASCAVVRAALARCRFPEAGASVTCAVSGGADSLALLVLAVAAHCDVTAVHVDHGLRPGSASEADVVEAAAQRLGAAFRSERVSLASGPNLEARARQARYGVLPADVLTGHTADDQAETVLLNLLRGSGLDGIAAMRPGPRRPLLGLRRRDTVELCEAVGFEPVQDPSNLDPAFRRNRVRHELLPLLHDIADRDVVPLLTRLSDHARDATTHLQAEAAALDPTDARGLAAAPEVLARFALRTWLIAATHDAVGPDGHDRHDHHPPDAATVERVLAVARGEARATDVGGGWRVRRSANRLHIEHGDDGQAPVPADCDSSPREH